MRYIFLFFVLFFPFAQSAHAVDMLNFLRMDVCDGSPSLLPDDPGCVGRRETVTNDTSLWYALRDWPDADAPCLLSHGSLQKLNIPVQWNGTGKERIGSFFDAGQETDAANGCGTLSTLRGTFEVYSDNKTSTSPQVTSIDRMSLHYAGADYIFVMASGSDNGFSYYLNPSTCSFADSRKYYNGWILAPRNMNAGDMGWIVNNAKLYNGATQAASTTWGVCPPPTSYGFTNWHLNSYTFKNSKNYQTLVSDHYADGTSGIANPADAQSKERTYFTDEFGLSRWEAWKRSDYVNGSGQTAAQLAKIVRQSGRCTAPYDMPANPTAQMTTTAVTLGTTGWYEDITNTNTATTKRWYMTDCTDYTNIHSYGRSVILGTPNLIPPSAQPDANYFFL